MGGAVLSLHNHFQRPGFNDGVLSGAEGAHVDKLPGQLGVLGRQSDRSGNIGQARLDGQLAVCNVGIRHVNREPDEAFQGGCKATSGWFIVHGWGKLPTVVGDTIDLLDRGTTEVTDEQRGHRERITWIPVALKEC